VEERCNSAIQDAIPVSVKLFQIGDPELDAVNIYLFTCDGIPRTPGRSMVGISVHVLQSSVLVCLVLVCV